ncbi:S8 family serine peptidase [Nostoc sp. XA010]|uniref:S8 family peptidase n=1 Tax=Nostoc sp. XA010 TaxID=2780407 RepID=UPI001E28B58F|nr:S8 family serine peptidase [Nostoc sp. XA010]MCC5660821.1 S8 family serine peptidase [Nostoc sp. XA010]
MDQNTKCWMKVYSNNLDQKNLPTCEQESSYQQLANGFTQKLITSGAIAIVATLGSFVAEVQAATFSLPIEAAAKATGVDVLRDRYNLDGSGITIGIISDSFATAETFDISGNRDTYATNIADGYLPSGVKVLKDYSEADTTDEGRALSQLIHAIAPGAKLAFHTDGRGADNLGQGIQALAAAGADIIVDDVHYVYPPDIPDAPLNQLDLEPPEGLINQAINTVVNQGVSYFTSAGNGIDIPIYGHSNNPNALTVGAVYYGNAESYSNKTFDVVLEQGQLEPFSREGNLDFLKPDVVAPDGLPISFGLGGKDAPRIANPGFFDFFGTSASAPYTAAVAALLLQADLSATPTEIYNALRNTADSPVSGFDSRLGFGLIQADKAIAALGVKPKPIPEPATNLAVICVGVLIAGLSLKRNQQRSKTIANPSERLTLVHSSFTQLPKV